LLLFAPIFKLHFCFVWDKQTVGRTDKTRNAAY